MQRLHTTKAIIVFPPMKICFEKLTFSTVDDEESHE